jgi:hypothetical protein
MRSERKTSNATNKGTPTSCHRRYWACACLPPSVPPSPHQKRRPPPPPPRPTSVRPDQPRRRGARVPPALRGPPGLSPCLPTSQGPPPPGGGGLTPAVQRGHRAGVLALQSSGCVWSSHRARLPNNHRAHLPTNHKQYENQHGPKGPSRSSTKHLLTQACQNYPQAPRGTRTLAYLLTQLFRSPAPQDELIKRVQGHRYKK